MQRSITNNEGRSGVAIPSTDPEIALVLWDDGDGNLHEVPITELTFIPD